MPDGPDYHKLFTEMNCLNGESNLKEITDYLRFYRSEGNFQAYLAHYLPMLPEAEFNEFIGFVADHELATSLKQRFVKPVEPEVAPVEPVTEPVEKPKKKKIS